jgi:outer membrane protein insertion porin family
MKDTKEKRLYRFFSTSKFLESNYAKDKQKILDKYNSMGYRDASIISDSVFETGKKTMGIKIGINEGHKYYFRNIIWTGNTKYTDKELDGVLGIHKGDIFDQSVLESHLMMNQNGNDVSSLYMDDGYLFFQVTPVEVNVERDSIDLEMRIYEGKQARINRIRITGNTKTNDKVIMREVRTKPGQLFSRADIIRSQRELAQLGYFNAEKLGINPTPNPADGTVDIEYVVEEKPSDQIELSGGWGGAQGGLVGSLGLSFNNFSASNIGKRKTWRPLPSGDGQKLSIRAQSNGSYYQSYNASFTEPWLGGKKPNSLSVTLYHSILTNGLSSSDANQSSTKISGLSIGFGKRLKFPDDFFTFFAELNLQNYLLKNSTNFLFTDGFSNNLNVKFTLSRNSIDQPLYPRGGSEFSVSGQFTPPYSSLNDKDYASLEPQEKYKWVEFHKWTGKVSWFTKVAGNLVISTRIKYGFLGNYNDKVGQSPFERFYVGGDGLSGFSLYGSDIVSLRGYSNNSLSPQVGSTVFDKYTFEIRYPLSLNPSATIYGLAFTEAGNAWLNFKDFNPFDLKRSAGFGVRVFLPMFGLLGLDWGYRLDDVPTYPGMDRSTFHFSIGGSID